MLVALGLSSHASTRPGLDAKKANELSLDDLRHDEIASGSQRGERPKACRQGY